MYKMSKFFIVVSIQDIAIMLWFSVLLSSRWNDSSFGKIFRLLQFAIIWTTSSSTQTRLGRSLRKVLGRDPRTNRVLDELARSTKGIPRSQEGLLSEMQWLDKKLPLGFNKIDPRIPAEALRVLPAAGLSPIQLRLRFQNRRLWSSTRLPFEKFRREAVREPFRAAIRRGQVQSEPGRDQL